MPVPTLFETCVPREDVRRGAVTESDFAADLAQVLRGDAPADYCDPVRFFANTHPTRGLKTLLGNVAKRLADQPDQVSSIFRLDTNYGGGKTHALIALAHAVRGLGAVPNAAEFLDPSLLPAEPVAVAAFDGENADPANGRRLAPDVRAHTPWGELAFALRGAEGFALVRRSDEQGVAPGADTLRELFAGRPVLILLDELSVYLRKVWSNRNRHMANQLTAFLTALFKAVESSPRAAVVFTLAVGKDDRRARDAYSQENQFIADSMAEAESVSARKATVLDPTEEDETIKVLRRRLFASIDEGRAAEIAREYRTLWDRHADHLPQGDPAIRADLLAAGYPLHPELIETLKEKTATLENFHRVRGMLRLLARTVADLWRRQPADTHAIQLCHIDPGIEGIRQEIATRLGLHAYIPAIAADVAAVEGEEPALAQQIDAAAYRGLPPYGSCVARTVLFHSLAFNERLCGIKRDRLRYSILSPSTDISFIDDAVRRLVEESAYLDDRPSAPLRFLTQANLTQIVRRQQQQIDASDLRTELDDRIRSAFSRKSAAFNPVVFAGMPFDVPDDAGDGKPYLVTLHYDAASVAQDRLVVPDLVKTLFRHKGQGHDIRLNRNNLLFVVADESRIEALRAQTRKYLALQALKTSGRMEDLAEHQREQLRGWQGQSDRDLATAVQQTYRHIFYPSKPGLDGEGVDLAHAAIDDTSSAAEPGDGHKQVIRELHGHRLRLPEDEPDRPNYVRDRTPLGRTGQMSTAALRAEFRRDPAQPMLVGDDVFFKLVRRGVEEGVYVYTSGDLIWARGEPAVHVRIDEQSFIYTAEAARDRGVWPRPAPAETLPPQRAAADQTGLFGPGVREQVRGFQPGQMASPPPATSAGEPEAAPDRVPDPAGPLRFTAEGPLRQALMELWDKARAGRVRHLKDLELRPADPIDGFRVMALVNMRVRDADKRVLIEGGYETQGGATLEIRYSGNTDDAAPVKDFLEPQLRAARDRDMEVRIGVTYTDGLDLDSTAPETLTEQLSRTAGGAAYVTATAQAADTVEAAQ